MNVALFDWTRNARPCKYQIRSHSVFGEIVNVGEKLAFVENSWREENEVERFMYLVNKKYYLT